MFIDEPSLWRRLIQFASQFGDVSADESRGLSVKTALGVRRIDVPRKRLEQAISSWAESRSPEEVAMSTDRGLPLPMADSLDAALTADTLRATYALRGLAFVPI